MRKVIQILIIVLALLSGCGTVVAVEDDALINTSNLVATLTPTSTPTSMPSSEPTATSTPMSTATPSPEPTATGTLKPTATPNPEPTATSTPKPTATPSPEPTATSTPKPTATPSPIPTNTPTPKPTATPKQEYAIMPNIVGMAWQEAKETLIAAGLQPSGIVQFEPSDTIPENHVVSQSIKSGTQLKAGTCVEFSLSVEIKISPLPTATPEPTPTPKPTGVPRPTATPIPTPMAEIVSEEPYYDIAMKTTYADGTKITQYYEDKGGDIDRLIYYPDGTVIWEDKDGSYNIKVNDMFVERYEVSWGKVKYYEYLDEGRICKVREVQDADSTETLRIFRYDENGQCISNERLIKKEQWYERYGIYIYLLAVEDHQDDTEYFRIANADGSYNQWSDVKYYDGIVAGLGSENLRLYTLEDKVAVNIPIEDLIKSGYGANDK